MPGMLDKEYESLSLKNIVLQLEDRYLTTLESGCQQAGNYLEDLRLMAEVPGGELYSSLCGKLQQELENVLMTRRMVFFPYVSRLQDKASEGHNCRECAGGCTIQHSHQVLNIREQHQRVKNLLYRTDQLAQPLCLQSATEAYHALRNELVHLGNTVTELFYLEESVLLPKVMDAQKQIYVQH